MSSFVHNVRKNTTRIKTGKQYPQQPFLRELKKTLSKTKEQDVQEIEESIQKEVKQLEDNQKSCDSEVSKLQKHYDAIVSTLNEIKKKTENS